MTTREREILTRSKTQAYEAFFHDDLQQYRMLPPKGTKRKLKADEELEEVAPHLKAPRWVAADATRAADDTEQMMCDE
jgi:hypothetical protein